MTIKRLGIFLICLFIYGENQSQQLMHSKANIMDKFDLNLFEKNKVGMRYTYKDGDRTILLIESKDSYDKMVSYDENAFVDQVVYYKKELTPKVIGQRLHDIIIGKIKYYDILGNLEKERDMDAPFTYSVYDLRDWIKKKYEIDIFEKKQGYMISRSENPYPHYMVRFITKEGKYIMYSIDGINGEIFYQNIDGRREEIKPMPNLKIKD